MDGITVLSTSEEKSEFLIEDDIKVIIISKTFDETGEMDIDYDSDKYTEVEVTAKVNECFALLIETLERKPIDTLS